MRGAFSRREWLRMAASSAGQPSACTAAGTSSGARPGGCLAAQPGIEPNTIKQRGTGFRGYDPARAFPGSTLFTPLANPGGEVYLVDLQGNVEHTWQMPYPGIYGYLTERGTLFYNGQLPSNKFVGRAMGLAGGVVLEANWSGKVLWELRHPDHHHDGRLLRNGNVLLLCATGLPDDVASQVLGGLPGTEADGKIFADYLVETTTDGQTVWEWRTWEHLDPAAHPITMTSNDRAAWTWGNAIVELPDGNILLSMRHLSTIVRINRQTDQIDWELGPPPLSGAHGVNPLANGNYLLFDNGPYRVDQMAIEPDSLVPFSRVLEIDPTSNDIVWTYTDAVRPSLFSPIISNPQRLPNGNTLINEGLFGRLFEVTPDGDTVWEFVNPYFGPDSVPPKAQTNSVFRAYRYTAAEIDRARRA
jgi:Arylsulfotransferase (ASST)